MRLTLDLLFAGGNEMVGLLTLDAFRYFALGPLIDPGVHPVTARTHPERGIPTYALAGELIHPGVGPYHAGWQLGLALGITRQGFGPLQSRKAFRRFMRDTNGDGFVEVRI